MNAFDTATFLAQGVRAVATSPAMPGWPVYRERIERERASHAVPAAPSVEALASVVRGRALEPLPSADVVGALISFLDDHRAPFPKRCFPGDDAEALIARMNDAPPHSIGPARLLELALERTGDAFRALLACHLAARQLARGRDQRAFRGPRLSLVERCDLGAAIAPFPDALACGGDPLGDTYHYLANVIAGVVAARDRTWGAAIARLFYAGPVLMSVVREGVFGNELFFGNHAHIDRLGLAHGLALAREQARGLR